MKRSNMFLLSLVLLLVLLPLSALWAQNLGNLVDSAKKIVSKSKNKDDKNLKENTPPIVYHGPKKRLAVSDMEVKVSLTTTAEPTTTGGIVSTTSISIPPPSDFGTGLTEMLTTSLFNTGRFILLERKMLADIQQEQSLGASGTVDPDSAAKTGKILGSQFLIRGAVTEYTYSRSSTGGNAKFLKGIGVATSKAEAMVGLDIRIYDTTTGQIMDSVKAEGRAKSSAAALDIDKDEFKMSASGFSKSPLGQATRQAIDRAVKFIVDRMEAVPWECKIAEIDEEDGTISAIYINAGTGMGLKEGQVLDIYRAGRAITDPETRVVIGRTKDKKIGQCRIQSVTQNLSIAEIIEGQGVKIDDVLRYVDPNVKITKPKEVPASSGNSENNSNTDQQTEKVTDTNGTPDKTVEPDQPVQEKKPE
ncbi:MAG: CsgG/HfaB family protein [Armatimonadota bacterium]